MSPGHILEKKGQHLLRKKVHKRAHTFHATLILVHETLKIGLGHIGKLTAASLNES